MWLYRILGFLWISHWEGALGCCHAALQLESYLWGLYSQSKAFLAWLRLFSPYLVLVFSAWAQGRKKKKGPSQMSKRLFLTPRIYLSEVHKISHSSWNLPLNTKTVSTGIGRGLQEVNSFLAWPAGVLQCFVCIPPCCCISLITNYPVTNAMQIQERDALAGQRNWRVLPQAVGWRWEAPGERQELKLFFFFFNFWSCISCIAVNKSLNWRHLANRSDG